MPDRASDGVVEVGVRRCGAIKPVSGRKPLICDRPAGHDGDHATLNALGALLVRWSQ